MPTTQQDTNKNDAKDVLKKLLENNPNLKGAYNQAVKRGGEEFTQAADAEGSQSATQQLLKQLTTLAKAPVGTGSQKGFLSSLISGEGIERRERTEPLGFKGAMDLLKLQQQVAGATPEARSAKAAATATGTDVAKRDIKIQNLRNDLDTYFEVAKLIPTGQGIKRFSVGLTNMYKALEQGDPRGVAAAQLNALNKRLRVSLVRAAGDVGNLNIVEQEAAEKLLFKFNDSTELRRLKSATLRDLTRSIKQGNSTLVKNIIGEWVSNPEFIEQNSELSKRIEKQNKSSISLERLGLDPNKFEIISEE